MIDVTPCSVSLFSTQNLNYILKDLANAIVSVSLATPKNQIKLKTHNNPFKKVYIKWLNVLNRNPVIVDYTKI